MRRNQVSLTITRVGDEVPKGFPEDRMVVNIYSDSNNLYAALSEAFSKAVNVMEEYGERVAVRCDIATNSDESIAAKALGRRYKENYNLEFITKRLEMDKQLLKYIENSTAILDVIKVSTKANVRKNLQEKLGYTQAEVANILRINFGMLTAEDIKETQDEIAQLELNLSKRKK